jgi:hypothetical protein
MLFPTGFSLLQDRHTKHIIEIHKTKYVYLLNKEVTFCIIFFLLIIISNTGGDSMLQLKFKNHNDEYLDCPLSYHFSSPYVGEPTSKTNEGLILNILRE